MDFADAVVIAPVKSPPMVSVPIVPAVISPFIPPVLIASEFRLPVTFGSHPLPVDPTLNDPADPLITHIPPLTTPPTLAEFRSTPFPAKVKVGSNAPVTTSDVIDGALIVCADPSVQDVTFKAVIGTALVKLESVTAPAVNASLPVDPAPTLICARKSKPP